MLSGAGRTVGRAAPLLTFSRPWRAGISCLKREGAVCSARKAAHLTKGGYRGLGCTLSPWQCSHRST